MEKISRIIPANARTKAVDVSGSQPVRPGAPTWGRPEGRVTRTPALDVQDRLTLSKVGNEVAPPPISPTYSNKVLEAKNKIVDDLAKRFFETNPKSETRETDLPKSEETLRLVEEKAELSPASAPSQETVEV